MKDNMIGLIGTGSMGNALARLLLRAGYKVIAWNRTAAKASHLKQHGAIIANDLSQLLTESETILISVTDYPASHSLLDGALGKGSLKGKTLIQLSTGTPQDAIDFEIKFQSSGMMYLDGAIMVTPSQMGTKEAALLISGNNDTFKKQEHLLQTLAPGTTYMGEKASLASAWELALLSYFFSSLIGLVHAAKIAQVEGIDISELSSTIENWSPAVGSIMKQSGDIIARGNYQDTESTVETCYAASALILRHAHQTMISTTYPKFALDIFEKAMMKGLTKEDGIAIIKTI